MRENNFGALRLFLATAVIWSHAPQLIDGNFSREPLVALGAKITLGTLAVDGFFIISGYLIASSFLNQPAPEKFLINRILRIYPAFIVASLFCIFLVAPLSGGDLSALGGWEWLKAAGRLAFLRYPEVPGSFNTLPIAALNGAMWTLRYEFNCYLLVLLLGISGLLARRHMVLAFTAALYGLAAYILLSGAVIPPGLVHKIIFNVIGDPTQITMLAAIFLSGVCFRLYEDVIRYSAALAFPLILLLIAALFFPLPDIAAGTMGAYILLWLALGLKSSVLQNINNHYDFSYGTYLYAWPICSLIVLITQERLVLSPLSLTAITTILALAMGGLSWYAVEKPALRLRKLKKRSGMVHAKPSNT